MLIVMKNNSTSDQVAAIIRSLCFTPQPVPGVQRTTIFVLGNKSRVDSSQTEVMDSVREIIHVTGQFELVPREGRSRNPNWTSAARIRDVVVITRT